jgi:hypothetical protein
MYLEAFSEKGLHKAASRAALHYIKTLFTIDISESVHERAIRSLETGGNTWG